VSRRIRVADIVGMPVVAASGERLGHVIDLEVSPTREVTAILTGRRGWLSRLRLRQLVRGHHDQRIPWRRVDRLTARDVRLRDG
jgi:sporulation protein YlmC with PRC-barrel domain